MSDNLKHTENLLTNVDDKLKLNNDKLDAISTNTANIKASIEVGGDLIVSVDDLESLQTTANNSLATIATNTGGSSSSSSTHTALLTDIVNNTNNNTLIQQKNTQIRDEGLTRNTTLNSISSRLTDIELNTANNVNILAKNTQIRDENLTRNTTLNSISSRLTDIELNTVKLDNIKTDLTDKVNFVEFSVNPITNPPSSTTKMLMTRDTDVGMAIVSLISKVDEVETAVDSSNTKLSTILASNADIRGFTSDMKDDTETIRDDIITVKNGIAAIETDLTGIDGKQATLVSTNSSIATSSTTIATQVSQSNSTTSQIKTAQDLTNTKLDTLQTTLTTIDSVLDNHSAYLTDIYGESKGVNILAKNTQIRDENLTRNTKLDNIKSVADDIQTNTALNSSILTKNTQIRDENLLRNTKLDNIKSVADDIQTNTANNVNILAKNTQIRDENLTRNTKLTAIDSRLTDIELNTSAIKTSVELLDDTVSTLSSATGTKGLLLMGKVGDNGGSLPDSGLAEGDAQFLSITPDGVLTVDFKGGLTENALSFNSGNKDDQTLKVAIATDDIPFALVCTKLDTLEASLTSMEGKIDTLDAVMDAILVRLNLSNSSGHFGNA